MHTYCLKNTSITARKSDNILLTYWKLFSTDTRQHETSDSDRKVNSNIYPDMVNVIGCV